MTNPAQVTFGTLNHLNRDSEFSAFRQQNLKVILFVLTILGVLFVMLWHIFDAAMSHPNLDQLLWLRIGTSAFYLVNLLIVMMAPGKIPIRIPVYLGFYAGVVFSTFLSYYTGGLMSLYWIELEFLILVWMVLIPFGYLELLINGAIFILVYSVPLLILEPGDLKLMVVLEYALLLLSSLLIGAIVAFFNNRFAAVVFLNDLKIKESEERFRLFNENVHDVIWTMDVKTRRFTYMSPSVFSLRDIRLKK